MNDQIYIFFTQVTYRYNILQECQILDTIFDSVVENFFKNEIRISARAGSLSHTCICVHLWPCYRPGTICSDHIELVRYL